MKKSVLIIIVLVFISILVFYNLPIEFHKREEIARGNELISNIEKHYETKKNIPSTTDWKTLREIGFSDEEMERAYPELRKLNDSTYELIYNLGFDPPYIMWNSKERVWKEDVPSIPDNWKKREKK